MSPPWLGTEAPACWPVTPGFKRTSPNAGKTFGPIGTLPVNVAVTLTAPETSSPETVTPLMPLSDTVIAGSAPVASAVRGRTTAPAVASTAVAGISRRNRFVIGLRPSCCQRLGPVCRSRARAAYLYSPSLARLSFDVSRLPASREDGDRPLCKCEWLPGDGQGVPLPLSSSPGVWVLFSVRLRAAASVPLVSRDPALAEGGVHRSLPVGLTSFVGRTKELARLESLLARHRMVSVIGPGGSGKTRLALEAARRLEGRFEAGAAFLELAPLEDSALGSRRRGQEPWGGRASQLVRT